MPPPPFSRSFSSPASPSSVQILQARFTTAAQIGIVLESASGKRFPFRVASTTTAPLPPPLAAAAAAAATPRLSLESGKEPPAPPAAAA